MISGGVQGADPAVLERGASEMFKLTRNSFFGGGGRVPEKAGPLESLRGGPTPPPPGSATGVGVGGWRVGPLEQGAVV